MICVQAVSVCDPLKAPSMSTDVLPDAVEAKILQHLQIIHHRLLGRRHINSIGPESLVQSTKHEDEFPVQQWTDNTVDCTLGNSPESSIALDLVFAQYDCDVVQLGRVG